MAAVHGPAIAQHPTSFQAHTGSRMGFHVAPPPVVCPFLVLSLSYLTMALRPANEGCCPTATAHPSRSILRSRKHSPALWALHNPSLRMSGIPPHIIGLEYKTPTLHRLRSASDETTLLRDFRFARLTATPESSIPHGSRILGPSTIYLGVHDRLQGHL